MASQKVEKRANELTDQMEQLVAGFNSQMERIIGEYTYYHREGMWSVGWNWRIDIHLKENPNGQLYFSVMYDVVGSSDREASTLAGQTQTDSLPELAPIVAKAFQEIKSNHPYFR